MAIKLSTKPNVDAPDATYPFGKIRDNTGSGDGTPVNTVVYGDIHQFFEKLMNAVGSVHNGQPDNESAGFQLFTALQQLITLMTAVITHTQVDKSIAVSYDSVLKPINDLNAAKTPGIGHCHGGNANAPAGSDNTDTFMLMVADSGVANGETVQLAIQSKGVSGGGAGTHYTRTHDVLTDLWTAWTQL